VKLAADANVLLSALIGGQAIRVLRHHAIESRQSRKGPFMGQLNYVNAISPYPKRLPVKIQSLVIIESRFPKR
jgi:hypothetical protein